jgi:Na+-driven multidrug efflux pump
VPPTDPVAQAKALKTAAVSLVLAGLIIGIGLPVILVIFEIQIAMTPMGFDIFWLAPLALMIVDFIVARWFWRRAILLERPAQGVRPQG